VTRQPGPDALGGNASDERSSGGETWPSQTERRRTCSAYSRGSSGIHPLSETLDRPQDLLDHHAPTRTTAVSSLISIGASAPWAAHSDHWVDRSGVMTASKKMMPALVALKPARTASAQCSPARWVRIPAATPPSKPSRRMRVERMLSSPALEEENGFNVCPSKSRLRTGLQLDPIRMGQHNGSDQWGKHSFPRGFRRSLLSIMLRGTQGTLGRTAVPSPGELIISRCSSSSLTRRYMPWIATMLMVRSASSTIVATKTAMLRASVGSRIQINHFFDLARPSTFLWCSSSHREIRA
jgi:hypothetical protein